jgi:hypothetical protein
VLLIPTRFFYRFIMVLALTVLGERGRKIVEVPAGAPQSVARTLEPYSRSPVAASKPEGHQPPQHNYQVTPPASAHSTGYGGSPAPAAACDSRGAYGAGAGGGAQGGPAQGVDAYGSDAYGAAACAGAYGGCDGPGAGTFSAAADVARDDGTLSISALRLNEAWTLKAGVKNKSGIIHWNNARGVGHFFYVDLIDEDEQTIRAKFFMEACDKFYDLIHKNMVGIALLLPGLLQSLSHSRRC